VAACELFAIVMRVSAGRFLRVFVDGIMSANDRRGAGGSAKLVRQGVVGMAGV
jgi:hypothetical protein